MDTNRILTALIDALQKPPLSSGTVLVCSATEAEWNTFVDRHDLPMKANCLQWFAETNEIHIVEIGYSHTHEAFVMNLHECFRRDPVVRQSLMAGGASKNTQGPAQMPDVSYGPKRSVPGAVLPPAIVDRTDLKTIKVEVAVSQRWGHALGQLDHKAVNVWAPMPGVQYVLCIKSLDDNWGDAEYKLYDVATNGPSPQFAVLPNPNPMAIAPGTEVHFDARRVLGIPPGAPLPTGFPDPFVLDLYAVLEKARLDM